MKTAKQGFALPMATALAFAGMAQAETFQAKALKSKVRLDPWVL